MTEPLDLEGLKRVVEAGVAAADDVSGRIHAGGYRGNLSDTEDLRNHVRRLAKATFALLSRLEAAEAALQSATAEIERLKQAALSANADADMYARAWQRELGRWMPNKRHHIDACVVGTRRLVAGANKAASYSAAVDRWRADALTARTFGVPEPSLLEYLPQDQTALQPQEEGR